MTEIHKTRDWVSILVFSLAAASLGASRLDAELTRAGGRPPPCASHPALAGAPGGSRRLTEDRVCISGTATSAAVVELVARLGQSESATEAPVSETEFRALLRQNTVLVPNADELEELVHHSRNQAFERKRLAVIVDLLGKDGVEDGAAMLKLHADAFGLAQSRYGVAPKDIAALMLVQAHRPAHGGQIDVPTFSALLSRILFLEDEVNAAVQSRALSRNHPNATARVQAARNSAMAGLPVLIRWAKKSGKDPLSVTGRLPGTVGPWGLPASALPRLSDGNGDWSADLSNPSDAIVTLAAVMADAGYDRDRASGLAPFELSGYSAKLVVALGDRIGWKAAGSLRPRASAPGVVAAAAAQPPAPPPPPKLAEEESADEASP